MAASQADNTLSQQLATYLAHGGVTCPHCQSEQIEGGFVTVEQGCAFQEVDCHSCNASWVDRYTLTAVQDFQPPQSAVERVNEVAKEGA